MDLKYRCQNCGTAHQATLPVTRPATCTTCGQAWAVPPTAAQGAVDQCLVCGCRHLFLRKDFPARLGAAIVIAGLLVSCVTWNMYLPIWTFAILFASAGLDLIVYLCVGDLLVCYRCRAEYRRFQRNAEHRAFDLETAERYRQEQMRLKG